MSDVRDDFPTTLGPDAVFKGQLQFEKGVRLLGRFDGEIASEGQLLIAQGAMLTGDVKAGTIRIEGQVKGNLSAKGKVHLAASAKLEGDVNATKLEVAEGAMLVGRCVVGVESKSKAQSVSRPASAPAAAVEPPKARPAPAAIPVAAGKR